MLRSSEAKKPVNLEDIFQEINRKYVRINKQEKLHNNVVLYSVLEHVLKLMRDSDELFNSMKPKLAYMGSYFDGLRVCHPSEFDINIVFKLPVNYEKVVLDSTYTQYDYTNVIMPSEFRRLCKNAMTADRGFKKTVNWCDGSYRLSVNKFRSWMQSVVDKALTKLPFGDGKRMLKIGNDYFGLVSKLAGPANNLTIYQGKNIIDIDLVPTFAFELPQIPINCKVDFSKREFNIEKKYFVVPKPTDNFSWRLSFPFQERLLLENKNNLKSVIRLLKLLRDVQRFNQIASYFIKSLCLREAVVKKELFWKKKSLSYLVPYMLTQLRDALAQNTINNFWCPDHNLLLKIKPETSENWSNRLTHILKNIKKNKDKNPLIIMQYFTPSEMSHFNYNKNYVLA